jgi:hypothetical protein
VKKSRAKSFTFVFAVVRLAQEEREKASGSAEVSGACDTLAFAHSPWGCELSLIFRAVKLFSILQGICLMKSTSWFVAALCCIIVLTISTSAFAANIAWVSFHGADNMPSAGAMGQGFTTEAPDKGYTDLLASAGHTVTRVLTTNNPTPAHLATLNSYDLVIVGRSVNSGHYGDPAAEAVNERTFWHTGILKPVIHMGGYALRSNRLGHTTGTTIPDTAGDIKLAVTSPSHPIFSGIALDAMNTMVNNYAGIVTMPVGTMTVQRGISVNTNPLAGGGAILATVGTSSAAMDPTLGGTIIAKWSPGAVMNSGEVLAGHRLEFLSGSREHAANASAVPPLTTNSEIAGIIDLTDDGRRMFLNAVNFMLAVPEPSTAMLLTFAVAGLGMLRKR